MRLLILSLLPLVAAQSASTCVSPISVLYNAHPECARSCLGCTDSNESFAHACDINGACCQGYNALTFIPLVYGCVKTTCTEADAQASWEEFSRNCARRGFPVNEGDTPGGYEFVSYSAVATTATASPTTSGGTATTTGDLRVSETSDPRLAGGGGNTTVAAPEASSGKAGLSVGEIVGIVLGSVSALAAVVGLVLRWRHLQLVKKQAALAPEKPVSSPMP